MEAKYSQKKRIWKWGKGRRLGANISADLLEQSGNPKSFIKRNKRN